jgi:hypothetical protein
MRELALEYKSSSGSLRVTEWQQRVLDESKWIGAESLRALD